MRTITTLVIACLLTLGASLAAAEGLVDVGLQKQLFIDDHVVSERQNVTREAGVATKHGMVSSGKGTARMKTTIGATMASTTSM